MWKTCGKLFNYILHLLFFLKYVNIFTREIGDVLMTIINTKFAEIWGAVLNNVEKELNDKTVFSNFFSNTQIVSIEGDTITIVAENSFAATVIKNKYLELIQEQLNEITQSNFKCLICDRNSYEAQNKINEILPTTFSITLSCNKIFKSVFWI